MAYRSNEPYNDLPLLPPSPAIETSRVLRRCITASRALAELKGAANLIPNQSILINSIPLQEARLSSEIENIVTTQDALFRAAIDEPDRTDPQTREVLRYRTALRHGYDVLPSRTVGIDLMIELCTILRNSPATLRDQERILVEDVGRGSIVYTPPRGRPVIVMLLRNLEAFLREPDGLDPLIKMAVAHYQFEAIHPFVDGNGRTGRILNLLVLVQAGLLELPVLYLSRYIEQAGILPPAARRHRTGRLGGVAALHVDRCRRNRPLDDRPYHGNSRLIYCNPSPLPRAIARPGLLEGTHRVNFCPTLCENSSGG